MKLLSLLWNALSTATIVTLVIGMFALALPPQYRATATVPVDDDTLLLLRSEDFLRSLINANQAIPYQNLTSFSERLLQREASLDPLGRLIRSLTVTPGDRDNWVNINIDAPDPKLATRLVVLLASSYEQRLTDKVETRPEIELAADRLTAAEETLLAFQGANPRSRNIELERDRIASLDTSLLDRITATRNEIDRLTQGLQQLQKGDPGLLVEDPAVRRAFDLRDATRLEREALASRYGTLHQDYIAIEAALRAARAVVAEEVKVGTQRAEQRLVDQRRLLDQLTSEQATLAQERLSLADLSHQLDGLVQERDAARRNYDVLKERTPEYGYSAAVVSRNLIASQLLPVLGMVFLVTTLVLFVVMLSRRHLTREKSL